MNDLVLSNLAKKIIPFTVAIAFFINALDAFILNIAIPVVAQSLHQPPLILKLAITSYLLSMGVFIPISGWLADRYGTRNIFLASIFVFGVGSLACGLSQNLWQLIASRLLQGVGGAMMMPVGRLVLNRIYPKSEIFRLMAMVAMMGLLGPTLGPIAGGVIVTYFSWRWIFFINLPFVLLGIWLVAKFMPNIKTQVNRLDWTGFLLFGSAIACIGFGFSAIGQQALPIILEVGLVLAGIVFILCYGWHHKATLKPFINSSIFTISTYRVAVYGGVILRLGASSLSFLMALLCQLVFHLSPIETALILLPYPLGLIVSKPFMKRIASAFGLRKVLFYNAFVLAALMFLFVLLNPKTELWLLLLNLFFFGISISLQYTSLQTLNIVNATPELLGQMISFASAMQQVTTSFSIALAALCLEAYFHYEGQSFSVVGFNVTFTVNAIIILLSSLSFYRLKPEDGFEFTGYKKHA